MTIDNGIRTDAGPDLRELAIERLKKRRDLGAHALVYVLVNGFLTVVWALATPDAIFWPVFPMVGWGIGLVMHTYDVYRGEDFSEERIREEMSRITRR